MEEKILFNIYIDINSTFFESLSYIIGSLFGIAPEGRIRTNGWKKQG